MKRVLTLILATGISGAVWADCPPVQDQSDRYYSILEEIQVAPSEYAAQPMMGALWEIWTHAPDEAAQDMLDTGMRRIRQGDYQGAITHLDELIAYCPHYAEGYNQRAFAYYLMTDYAQALADLDHTLELFPDHVAAMSGRVLTLIGMGRARLAQQELRRALDLHPWLPERRLLAEPPGEEL